MPGTIEEGYIGTQLWECDDCGFRFDASHAEEDGSYSCPCCEVAQLRHAAHNLLTAIPGSYRRELADVIAQVDAAMEAE